MSAWEFLLLITLHYNRLQLSHNAPLSDALSPRPTKQIRNSAYVRGKCFRVALALNIQANERLGVRAAQVKPPIIKG